MGTQDKNPFAAVLLIALVCIFVFALESDGQFSATSLGISGATLVDGEWARAMTFMFAHNGLDHLLVNLVGLASVGVLAWELRLSNSTFLSIFILAGLLTVVPVALLMTDPYTFLGASAGVSGLFGAIAVEFKRYGFPALKVFMIFAIALVFGPMIEAWQVQSVTAAIQALMHVTALIVGAELALSHMYWSTEVRLR